MIRGLCSRDQRAARSSHSHRRTPEWGCSSQEHNKEVQDVRFYRSEGVCVKTGTGHEAFARLFLDLIESIGRFS